MDKSKVQEAIKRLNERKEKLEKLQVDQIKNDRDISYRPRS
ncbi:MAG: hypothetical protein ACP5LF_06265 [Nitrososphaeria archaeon]